jgi:hypothetical protein
MRSFQLGKQVDHTTFGRKLMLNEDLDNEEAYGKSEVRRWVVGVDDANLITSLTEDGRHAPVLDLDFGASLVPSTTEGHWHLYLDKTMTWRQYRRLLKALGRAGVLERGFVKFSLRRKFSAVRKPGQLKPFKPAPPASLTELRARVMRDGEHLALAKEPKPEVIKEPWD